MANIVLDVLTVKDSDSRPTLTMSIEDINEATDQPTTDTQFDGYTVSEFEAAERIEFHMDWEDPSGDDLRVVDGREATWDSQAEEISVDLQRSDTARLGQYYFEWVLIHDSNVTDLANATEVNTIPDTGYFGLQVNEPTDRALNAVDEPDRNVGHIWLGEQSDTPTDSEIGSGNVAFYAKDDGNLYTKPHGGTESGIGSASNVALNLNNDAAVESTALTELATANDANNVVTEPTTDTALFDMSANWPAADTADGLSSGAVDAIGEIAASLRSGIDPTLITGTSGTSGNVPEFNTDGDIVDSGAAASDIGSGTGSAVEVAEDGTSLTTDVSLIDVLNGLTATEPATGEIDLDVDESEVDHDSLSGFVSNEHVDHSSVSVSSGTGLSGGGDLTASRTLSLSAALSDLSDASISTPASGELVLYHSANSQFENAALTAGTHIGKSEGDASLTLNVTGDTNALDGSAGTDGQVWTSTGSGAAWENATGGSGTVDLENTDGNTLVSASAIQAGTDLEAVDDGDGTGTLNFVGSGGGSSGVFAAYEIADDGTNGFTTIQGAINNLPSNGGVVEIAPSYANSDTLPISVSKPVKFIGHGWGTGTGGNSIGINFSGNTTNPVFDVDVGIEQPRHSIQFENLRIEGGDIGVSLGSGGFYRMSRVWIQDQATNNIQFKSDGGGLYSLFDHCFFEAAGEDGVDMQNTEEAAISGGGSQPHATTYHKCLFTDSGRHGIYADCHGTVIDSCAIEASSSAGIAIAGESTSDINVTNCYFEANAQDESGGSQDCDIYLGDSTLTSKLIKGNWHSSAGPADKSVHAHDTYNARIENVWGEGGDVVLSQFTTDVSVGWVDPRMNVSIDSGATRARRGALAQDSGSAETPTASNYKPGALVDWTDSGDNSGDGVYVLDFSGSWVQLG